MAFVIKGALGPFLPARVPAKADFSSEEVGVGEEVPGEEGSDELGGGR